MIHDRPRDTNQIPQAGLASRLSTLFKVESRVDSERATRLVRLSLLQATMVGHPVFMSDGRDLMLRTREPSTGISRPQYHLGGTLDSTPLVDRGAEQDCQPRGPRISWSRERRAEPKYARARYNSVECSEQLSKAVPRRCRSEARAHCKSPLSGEDPQLVLQQNFS